MLELPFELRRIVAVTQDVVVASIVLDDELALPLVEDRFLEVALASGGVSSRSSTLTDLVKVSLGRPFLPELSVALGT